MTQVAFQYKAIDRQGGVTKGAIRADDRQQAYREIVAAGLKPIRIAPTRRSLFAHGGKRIKVKDLAHLTHQLAVLLEARVPIVQGLEAIAEQEPNEQLRSVINDISVQISSGCTVTEALAPHRELFGDVYVETVRAAEISGNMVEVLSHLGAMLEQQYEMRKRVKGALMYPICVVVALILAVTFLMIFVVPRFARMFAARGLELPLPTQIVIGVSTFMQSYWYLLLLGGFIGWWGFKQLHRRPGVRNRVDAGLHRVPVLRDMFRGLAVSRFAHVLGLSFRSGLNLIDALDMAGRASGRPLLEVDTERMKDQVNHGGRLTDCLNTCQYIPGFAKRMISAGEEAGELPRMCELVARHYDRETEHITRNLSTLIEPMLIAGLAGVVLIIALAIFLPMWNMAALLG